MIPRFLHQIWIGNLPPPVALLHTWRDMHPDWIYRLWTDEKRCDGKPWKNQKQIDASPSWQGKCDIMRYEVLERWGGVYLDADSKCLRPLDDRFLTGPWTAYENEVKAPGILANGALGAEPCSMLMTKMVQECSTADVLNRPAWKATGPLLLTRVAEKFPILKFPSQTFYPKHWTGFTKKLEPGDSPIFAEQLWGSTNKIYEKLATESTFLKP